MTKSEPAPSLILVGAIAGAFGVHGEVRVRSFTGVPEAIFDYGPLLDDSGRLVLEVSGWRPVPDGFAVTSPQVTSREQAMLLRNTRLNVPRDRLPEADEDEFYHVDLIGLAVEGLDGGALGVVQHVLAGAQDLLVIHRTPGVGASWYLPFTRDCVPVVDLAGGRLVADVPNGLIPEPHDGQPPSPPPDTETGS